MATMGPHDLPLGLTLLAGFLLGSVPFSLWMGRAGGVRDVRRHGSGNPGAANVWRNAGRLLGIAAGALDAAKGAAAVWLAWWAGLPDHLAIWPGVAAVLGHDFSPWLGWRGGKGGATTAGMLACFLFPELLLVLACWIAWCAIGPRTKFLGSIVAISLTPLFASASGRLAFPPADLLPPRPWAVVAASALLVALLWLRVAPGLRAASRS
jgi:glycerol-3-phosphate acyltransferase PlsY